jgi:RNA polymerase sigma-70 factor (ECF subfamily)
MTHATPPQSRSDLKLIKDISAGDETAFSEFYSRYNKQVYNYILRLIHQTTAAEDVLQEVFIAIWQGSSRFEQKSTVKTWVFRIAYHQSISWLRKNKKLLRQNQNIDEIPAISIDPSPENSLIMQWQETQIRSALERLSPNHRSVIELTFVQGFSYQEIAEIMRCPIGTVKSRMSYALKYIKSDLLTNQNTEF